MINNYLNYLQESSIPTKWRQRVEIYIIKGDKIIVGYKRKYQDKYMPAGGGVEKGQTLIQACHMECLEELGIKIKNPVLITKETKKVDWYKLQKQGIELTGKIPERMKEFRGSEIFFFKAEFDGIDKKYYGRDNDSMKPVLVTKETLIKHLNKQWDVSKFRVKIVRML